MEPIEKVAERLLTAYDQVLSSLVERPGTSGQIVFMVVSDADWPAATSNNLVYLNRTYFTIHPDDKGAIIHEIVHAIQRAPKYEGEFIWLIEGLADFIRHYLNYGKLEYGDPRKSYKYAAGFWNYLYLNNFTEYSALVIKINNGILPETLDQLLQEYSKTYSQSS